MKMIDFWKLLRLPLIQFSRLNNFLWVCWFLGKILSNFVPPVWKLHNPYCHTGYQPWFFLLLEKQDWKHMLLFLGKFIPEQIKKKWICGRFYKSPLVLTAIASGGYRIVTSSESTSPQVRLKMNDKKPSKFQFYFSGVVEAFSMLKKSLKNFC